MKRVLGLFVLALTCMACETPTSRSEPPRLTCSPGSFTLSGYVDLTKDTLVLCEKALTAPPQPSQPAANSVTGWSNDGWTCTYDGGGCIRTYRSSK